MSNAKTLHLQWADGEIEAGTLIEALYKQEQTIAILRQHKNDYMDAAECTRKYLEAENAKLRAELAAFKSAVDHVTADGKTTRSFSASEGWAMVHTDRLTDLHVAEEQISKLRAELERRAVDGWKLVPVEPTPEMVSAAEEAYMPFGDMDIALRMAILAAPYASGTAAEPDGLHIGAWRDALQKIAKYAPPVNHAARTEIERVGLIAVHALIAFSAPQFIQPAAHQEAINAAAPSAPKADDPVKVQLLEALEYSLPYLMACVPNPRNGINADGSVDVNCVDRARAAIAAARKGEGK